jgi:hypothetical protein
MEIKKEILYYGCSDPVPSTIPLKAGPLSLVYAAGELRYIRLGDKEIIRRIYVAVRDHNWGTISPILTNQQLDAQANSFSIKYDVTHQHNDIDFFWQGSIVGDADGTITFVMRGEARSTFMRNRIGFCILHPLDCAGLPVKIEHVNGLIEASIFPEYIAPQLVKDGHPCPVAPFENMCALTHQVLPDLWAEVYFEGDIFEMEDQRNWTDASFKTYCTPLSLPFPLEIQSGTKINQVVRLTLHGKMPEIIKKTQPLQQPILLKKGASAPLLLPKIGLGFASHGQPLSPKEINRLKILHLSHLRVDLYLSDPQYPFKLRQASTEAILLGISMEIAIFFTQAAEYELNDFLKILQEIKPPVMQWLIFHVKEKTTTAYWINIARQYLLTYDATAKIISGSNAYFTEVNANRLSVVELDGIVYSINPQVHAFDNLSLTENLAAQAATVASTRRIYADKPIVVSPVTLKPRFNPNASGPEPESETGNLPSQVDERQSSLYGLGWTLGSLKYLAESGVDSITYYETTGWRGVMEQERGSLLPEKFWSIPGGVYPLYHLFADVAEMGNCQVIPMKSSQPLFLDSLLLENGNDRMMLLTNFTAQTQIVELSDIPAVLKIRRINETNVREAMRDPESFRLKPFQNFFPHRKRVILEMMPYETLRINYPN